MPPWTARVLIVTGASRGIGAATAVALGGAGASVVLAARDADALEVVAEQIGSADGCALSMPTDVSDPVSVQRLVEQTMGAFGPAGRRVQQCRRRWPSPTRLAEVGTADFDSAVHVGLRGTFLSMKYEIPAMVDGGGGAIVNMASTAGLEPVAGLAGYVSSKAGVIALTRTAALDYADAGVRVNALAPGPILTERLEALGAQAQEHAARAVPMGRIGRPSEVSDVVAWLCSDQSSFVTGATVPIDGGMLAGMPPFAGGRPVRQASKS